MQPSETVNRVSALLSIVLGAAIFGFFYAWVCSTMWGLDAADPRVAIEAMQAMNASVRNAVFFPAFFLTPVAMMITGVLMRRSGHRRASQWFIAAVATYLLGGLLLTMAINVPMNERLADTAIPASIEDAQRIWNDYSGRWQLWNAVRTIVSGVALVMAAMGLSASAKTGVGAPDSVPGAVQPGSIDAAARAKASLMST